MDDQRRYWDQAAGKTFAHPLEPAWLMRFVKAPARMLDYGCGYGRVVSELAALGHAGGVGVDFSAQMIARGRRDHPDLDLRLIDGLPLAEPDGAFDLVTLFAVLTCIPDDATQDAVLGECRRLLRPGGIIYISDMPLQTSFVYRDRYAAAAPRYGLAGVFETTDGAVVRHHDERRLGAWLKGFELLARREVDVVTMNGTPARAVQLMARKPT